MDVGDRPPRVLARYAMLERSQSASAHCAGRPADHIRDARCPRLCVPVARQLARAADVDWHFVAPDRRISGRAYQAAAPPRPTLIASLRRTTPPKRIRARPARDRGHRSARGWACARWTDPVRCSWPVRLNALDDDRGSHTSCGAHGDQAAPQIAALEFVEH